MKEAILSVENFSKTFRGHWLVQHVEAAKNISFSVAEGIRFGLLGHNGAGKTTTLKALLGLIRPSAGKFFFQGQELKHSHQRAQIGFLPEQPYFYAHLNVEETLLFFGQVFGLKGKILNERVSETLALVGLEARRKTPVRLLSKGLQQRVGLAQAIINRPKLLLLDEPLSGLDPLGRKEVRELINQLYQDGTTVLLCSHILSDVEDLCDEVIILSGGEVKAALDLHSPEALGARAYTIEVKRDSVGPGLIEEVADIADSCEEIAPGRLRLKYQQQKQARETLEQLLSAGAEIQSFGPALRRLEDVFVDVIQGKTQ